MNAQRIYTQQFNTRTKIRGVVLFGDSVLFGTGASTRNTGCGRILRGILTEMPIVIKGRNRDTTEDGLQRLKPDVLEDAICSHVIILFGNNDCRLIEIDKPIVSLEKYQGNLIQIIRQIKSVGKVPILSNLQPIDSGLFYKTLPHIAKLIITVGSPNEFQKRYSIVCDRVARDEGIKLADIRTELEKYNKATMASDGLHPNDLGHELIAQKFLEILMQ